MKTIYKFTGRMNGVKLVEWLSAGYKDTDDVDQYIKDFNGREIKLAGARAFVKTGQGVLGPEEKAIIICDTAKYADARFEFIKITTGK